MELGRLKILEVNQRFLEGNRLQTFNRFFQNTGHAIFLPESNLFLFHHLKLHFTNKYNLAYHIDRRLQTRKHTQTTENASDDVLAPDSGIGKVKLRAEKINHLKISILEELTSVFAANLVVAQIGYTSTINVSRYVSCV